MFRRDRMPHPTDMIKTDCLKSVRAGGLAQVGAKVLLADLGNGAVLAQLIDSLVQSFAQGGGFIALAQVLEMVLAVVLPFRSSKLLMLSSSLFTIMAVRM